MASTISIQLTDNKQYAGETNAAFPVDDWKSKVRMSLDTGGLMMFECAAIGVAFTGVVNCNSGKISLAPVVPRKAAVDHDIGGFTIEDIKDKARSGMTKRAAVGPETVAFNKAAMPPSKAMQILGARTFQPIDHENLANTLPKSLGTSHEILAKEAENIPRTVGKGVRVPEKSGYVGFTLTKGEGSAMWPHEIIFRSGTFNSRFTTAGKGIPGDWALVVTDALQGLIPEQPLVTRQRAKAIT